MFLLPSAYLAPVSYYRFLASGQPCLIEVMDSYQKQTYRNRCVIADANGPLALTIPVEKPLPGRQLMRDIRISDHGRWRHLHWNALKSAYQNSPFFEYYADDFAPFFERKWDFLADFNEDLMHLVCQLTNLDPQTKRTTGYLAQPETGVTDLRAHFDPQQRSLQDIRPYYQVFAQKLGFLPDLSIVDLLFNMGPESILYL